MLAFVFMAMVFTSYNDKEVTVKEELTVEQPETVKDTTVSSTDTSAVFTQSE